MLNAIKQFDSDKDRLSVINSFLINSDIVSIIIMILHQSFQCIIDLMLSNHESRSKTRSIRLRFSDSYDFDHIRKKSRRHRKKIDQTSHVLRKKDDMFFNVKK